MAGIGFQLRKLSREDTLTGMMSAVGHASMIAAGPWLFTIVSLATGEPRPRNFRIVNETITETEILVTG